MTDDNSMIRVQLAHPSQWVQIPTDVELDVAINMLIKHWNQLPMATKPEVEPVVTVVKFHVSCLPPDQPDSYTWGADVEYDGRGNTWAVRHSDQCLHTDGEWDPEPQPSSRDKEWRASHRFTLAKALIAARDAAPDIEVNGQTATEIAMKKTTST